MKQLPDSTLGSLMSPLCSQVGEGPYSQVQEPLQTEGQVGLQSELPPRVDLSSGRSRIQNTGVWYAGTRVQADTNGRLLDLCRIGGWLYRLFIYFWDSEGGLVREEHQMGFGSLCFYLKQSCPAAFHIWEPVNQVACLYLCWSGWTVFGQEDGHIFKQGLHAHHFPQMRVGKETARVAFQDNHAPSDSLPSCLLLWET